MSCVVKGTNNWGNIRTWKSCKATVIKCWRGKVWDIGGIQVCESTLQARENTPWWSATLVSDLKLWRWLHHNVFCQRPTQKHKKILNAMLLCNFPWPCTNSLWMKNSICFSKMQIFKFHIDLFSSCLFEVFPLFISRMTPFNSVLLV